MGFNSLIWNGMDAISVLWVCFILTVSLIVGSGQ